MNFEILNLTLSARTPDECKMVQLLVRDLVEESEVEVDKVRVVSGVDVSYVGNYGIGVMVSFDIRTYRLVEKVVARGKVSFPYIPGFLAFREIPLIIDAFAMATVSPDIVIVDGQGIAHPRRAGIATHLGTIIQKPTIGCAKSLLYGEYVEIPNIQGYEENLLDPVTREVIGKVVRTKRSSKPVFVSIGNYITLEQSVFFVKKFAEVGQSRLPIMTLVADKVSKEEKKKLSLQL